MHFTTPLLSAMAAFATISTTSAAALQPRAMTAAQVVTNINAITQQSQDLQTVASSIQTGQTAIAKRQDNPFQPLISGFQQIISTAQTDITAMDGTQSFDQSDAQTVCTAFHNFVVVHQELLKIVIGKSGLLESIFLGPMAAVLRSLEDVVDTLAFGVIDSVPYCEASATTDKENLDDTLGKAVCAYTPGGTLGLDLFC